MITMNAGHANICNGGNMYKARKVGANWCHRVNSTWIIILVLVPGVSSLSIANGPVCDEPKKYLGLKTVFCRSYTIIPTDIPNPYDVHVLDMSEGNAIQVLHKGQLERSKLWFLYSLILKKCQIHYIEAGAFSGGSSFLTELDISYNNIEVLNPQVFEGLTLLRTLKLNNNPINRFEVGTVFPPLPLLNTLNLKKCELDEIPVNVFDKLTNIKTINLKGNYLKHLDWRVFRKTMSLDVVNLDGNPWRCDCHVKFLMEFLQEEFLETSFRYATCDSTSNPETTFIGAKWVYVPNNEMVCNPKIEKMEYNVLQRAVTREDDDNGAEADEGKVAVGDDVYFECEYTGHPEPEIKWLKEDKPIKESSRFETRGTPGKSKNEAQSTFRPELKPRIEFQDLTFEITTKLEKDEQETNYRFRKLLIIRRVEAEDKGRYSCFIRNVGGHVEKIVFLNVTAPTDVFLGGMLPREKKGLAAWMWILIVLLSVLILASIALIAFLILGRKEGKREDGFGQMAHVKCEDSSTHLGDLSQQKSPLSQQLKYVNQIEGSMPLLDNRMSSKLMVPIRQQADPLRI